MRRRIGQAGDYYRCRIVEINENRPQALDWRDDLLYREAPPPSVSSATRFIVQVVAIDATETHDVKAYPSELTAEKKKTLVEEDLWDLTRSEFTKKYGLPWQ